MAPPTATSMNTRMATEATTCTNPNTSSKVDGRGIVAKRDAKEERDAKHRQSQKKLLTNIRGEYLRMRKMIPDIRDVDGIEAMETKMLNAFDKEARDQLARRHMLLEQIADWEKAIREHQGDEK
ncbi:hypothetical protein JMJ35_008642 [Cladonia borealis]|uniref:Uncharacterized protein n=1 Tax=Cladonia borealis TaxID=184061 RepID=A0AA39QWS4_9LECA|nr:hypothetical protein JMJ35_008642 [Cladonia borealis]